MKRAQLDDEGVNKQAIRYPFVLQGLEHERKLSPSFIFSLGLTRYLNPQSGRGEECNVDIII